MPMLNSPAVSTTYDLPDFLVKVYSDEDPNKTILREHLTSPRGNTPIAVAICRSNHEEFLCGDEDLYNLASAWETYESSPGDYDEPTEPKPIIETPMGSPTEGIKVYFSDDDEEQDEREEFAQVLANYVFNQVYLISVTWPSGKERMTYPIETYQCGDYDLDDVIDGTAETETVERVVEWLGNTGLL